MKNKKHSVGFIEEDRMKNFLNDLTLISKKHNIILDGVARSKDCPIFLTQINDRSNYGHLDWAYNVTYGRLLTWEYREINKNEDN